MLLPNRAAVATTLEKKNLWETSAVTLGLIEDKSPLANPLITVKFTFRYCQRAPARQRSDLLSILLLTFAGQLAASGEGGFCAFQIALHAAGL